MEIKTLEFSGLLSSLQAMRLPHKSKNDSSGEYFLDTGCHSIDYGLDDYMTVGDEDLKLATKLIKAGTEHAKFTRGIVVWAEINAPRYWWQECDTYCIGKQTLSSESTMHTILKDDITQDNFSTVINDNTLCMLNGIRESIIIPIEKKILMIKGKLPESFKQKRIVTFNYQCLRNIYFQRRSHRLPEWHVFCDWIKTLPFADKLITVEK